MPCWRVGSPFTVLGILSLDPTTLRALAPRWGLPARPGWPVRPAHHGVRVLSHAVCPRQELLPVSPPWTLEPGETHVHILCRDQVRGRKRLEKEPMELHMQG